MEGTGCRTANITLQNLVGASRQVTRLVAKLSPTAYSKRGKIFASSFAEAEFWGWRLDVPQRVSVAKACAGDERAISKVLGIPSPRAGVSVKQISAPDSKWRNAALRKGFDSILVLAPQAFAKFKTTGELPRSL